jgi:hypothetical protein
MEYLVLKKLIDKQEELHVSENVSEFLRIGNNTK